MGNTAAEELFIKHDRDRREAHQAGKRLADRLVVLLSSCHSLKQFGTVDLEGEGARWMQELIGRQRDYNEADLATRNSAREAIGD